MGTLAFYHHRQDQKLCGKFECIHGFSALNASNSNNFNAMYSHCIHIVLTLHSLCAQCKCGGNFDSATICTKHTANNIVVRFLIDKMEHLLAICRLKIEFENHWTLIYHLILSVSICLSISINLFQSRFNLSFNYSNNAISFDWKSNISAHCTDWNSPTCQSGWKYSMKMCNKINCISKHLIALMLHKTASLEWECKSFAFLIYCQKSWNAKIELWRMHGRNSDTTIINHL